jgi:hypothetical protein
VLARPGAVAAVDAIVETSLHGMSSRITLRLRLRATREITSGPHSAMRH